MSPLARLIALMGKPAPGVPTTWTFTYSTPFSANATPSGQAAMQDSDITSNNSFYASDASVLGQFITADFGSNVQLTSIFVRGVATTASGGWGAVYTNGCVIEYSSDNSIWTTAATVSGLADNSTTPYIATPGPLLARYVRLRRATVFGSSGNYCACGDFYFT